MKNEINIAPAQQKRPVIFYGNIVVLIAFLVFLTQMGVQYSYGVFFKPVLNEFGWTREMISGAYSLSWTLSAICGIISGKLADRFGPRAMVIFSGALVGLGFMLMSRVEAVWQYYLFYGVLASIGLGSAGMPILSAIARWFTAKRGLATGIAMAGIGVGMIIMPPIANKLISIYEWRTSFFIIGLAGMIITVTAGLFMRRGTGQMQGSSHNNAPKINITVNGLTLKEALRARQLWIIGFSYFFYGFCLQTVMVHIIPHATDTGISAASAASIISVLGIVSIGGKLGWGHTGDRIGYKRILVIVFILLAASFLLVLQAKNLWMLYVFAALFGLGYGGLSAIMSPVVAEFFGLKEHGAILGIVNFMTCIGGALGPLTAGRIFDVNESYKVAFILCATICLVSLTLTTLLKHRDKETAAYPKT